ncbi:hypothetical protein [Psychrobacter frigidicola]|uniref:hypothetical protein n=1 Tax=Psychrobacter frigidicola TaxID=45611 RepID=UPI001919370F|nr:hypothetical protein [Psychrobacter frigidicola]
MQIDSNFQLKLSLGGKPYQLKENDRLERLTIFLALEANEIQTYSSTKIYEVAEQALSSVKIKFNYIYADTSSSDIYELKFNEDNNSFTKITDEVL